MNACPATVASINVCRLLVDCHRYAVMHSQHQTSEYPHHNRLTWLKTKELEFIPRLSCVFHTGNFSRVTYLLMCGQGPLERRLFFSTFCW